jgi:festuclavine dehydrogenase
VPDIYFLGATYHSCIQYIDRSIIMTILLVPGTAQTSLAIAANLAGRPSSPSYVLAVRNDNPRTTTIHHPTINLSLSDPTTWQPAFTSPVLPSPITTIYLLAPPLPDAPTTLTTFIHAALRLTARTGGLKRIVFLSSSLIPINGPAHGQIHALLDRLTSKPEESGLGEYAVLRPSWFAQNFLEGSGGMNWGTVMREGRVYSATGEGRVPFVDVGDIAAVAAEVLVAERLPRGDLLESEEKKSASVGERRKVGGKGEQYLILGPQPVTYSEIAEMMAEILRRPVEHVSLTVDQLAQKLVEVVGMDVNYAPVLAGLDGFIARGAEERTFADAGGGCVRRILGREAKEVKNVLRDALAGRVS